MNVRTITVLATALALTACAEDDRTGHEPTAKERAVATSLISQARAIDTLTSEPADAPRLLTASAFSSVVSMLAPDGMSIALPGRDHVRDLRPCITQTSETVVYTDCEIGEHIVEGSLSGLAQRLKVELVDVFVIGPENHGAATIKASINADTTNNSDEQTQLDGTLELDVMWTASGTDNTMDASVRFADVALDSSGCAVAGSISITGHVGDAPSTSRTLNFGPSCGDVRVAR